MRGKDTAINERETVCGITPAYAGKSMELSSNIMVSKDHPRLCGEKVHAVLLQDFCKGSPPPMRGKGHFRKRRRKFVGITPAYAGKRPFAVNKTPAGGDHPRLCGEKYHKSKKKAR